MKVGRYRVLWLLARGGISEVYLGRLEGAGGFVKPVVLKALKPSERANRRNQRALMAEARIGSYLNHPNIIQTLDFLEQEEQHFLITEYLHGVSLRQLIMEAHRRQERLDPGLCVTLIRAVLSALDFAHQVRDERGQPLRIVHRDVSPENIFLCASGNTKLIDFGIAQSAVAPRDTKVAMIRGKVRYLSPEQAKGGSLSGSSDVYSAGLVLFELLAGTAGLEGGEVAVVLERARRGELDWSYLQRSGAPEVLIEILRVALWPQVEGRYRSAGEMLQSLRVWPEHYEPSSLQRLITQWFGAQLAASQRAIWGDQQTQVSNNQQVREVALHHSQVQKRPKSPRYSPEIEVVTTPMAPKPKRKRPSTNSTLEKVDIDRLRRAITEAYDD